IIDAGGGDNTISVSDTSSIAYNKAADTNTALVTSATNSNTSLTGNAALHGNSSSDITYTSATTGAEAATIDGSSVANYDVTGGDGDSGSALSNSSSIAFDSTNDSADINVTGNASLTANLDNGAGNDTSTV